MRNSHRKSCEVVEMISESSYCPAFFSELPKNMTNTIEASPTPKMRITSMGADIIDVSVLCQWAHRTIKMVCVDDDSSMRLISTIEPRRPERKIMPCESQSNPLQTLAQEWLKTFVSGESQKLKIRLGPIVTKNA